MIIYVYIYYSCVFDVLNNSYFLRGKDEVKENYDSLGI